VFKKKNHLIGLDIGSKTIKAGEIIETRSGNRLENFGVIDLSPGFIMEGMIKEPEAVADSIRQLLSEQQIKEQNVAISIGGYSVIVKKIIMDMMEEDQLQANIHFEAEQYIPFDINDVNIDFHIQGESQNNPNKIDVLLIAAKKSLVNDYVDLVQMAGLNPCIIDVDHFALQNIFELNYNTESESVALIDIGASKTSLNILKENISIFTRDVSLGCGLIDQKISALLDCDHNEAEMIKKNGKADAISTSDLREIISTVGTDWSTEIRRALDFYYSTYPEEQIKHIYLSGGGAHIVEFHNLLSREASVEVETLNPFANLTVNSDRVDTGFLEKIAPQAAICLGLSLRRVDDK
jgi:type IV pilus assembly protein PilM